MSDTIHPNETGFDTRLRDMAATILNEEAPDLAGPFGREQHLDSLFTAMQTNAAAKGMSGTPNDFAACETLGRAWVRVKLAGHGG